MTVIDFKQIPQVALDFMNKDHAEAVALLNELQAGLVIEDAAARHAKVSQALQALLDHNRAHFAREEAQMQAYAFPPFPVHKSEHEHVLAEMEAQLQAWQQQADVNALQHYANQSLPYWFVNHISTMDTVTAQFIANQGGPQTELL